MPHVDGMKLLQRIRKDERGEYLYVIVLTAKAKTQDAISAMGAGADDFFAKPVYFKIHRIKPKEPVLEIVGR